MSPVPPRVFSILDFRQLCSRTCARVSGPIFSLIRRYCSSESDGSLLLSSSVNFSFLRNIRSASFSAYGRMMSLSARFIASHDRIHIRHASDLQFFFPDRNNPDKFRKLRSPRPAPPDSSDLPAYLPSHVSTAPPLVE